MRTIKLSLLALLLCLCVLSAYAAGPVVVGPFDVENPKITVKYTVPVNLVQATLTSLETDAAIREYTLRSTPPIAPEPPAYTTTFVIATGTAETPQYFSPGRYQMFLQALDQSGRYTSDIVEFTVTGMEIKLVNPPNGIAQTSPYNLEFTTLTNDVATESSCTYSKIGWTSGTLRIEPVGQYSSTHSIEGLTHNGYLYIECAERSGRKSRRQLTVGWDDTPPIVTLTANPRTVSNANAKSSVLTIKTNEPSACTLDGTALENPQSIGAYKTVRERQTFYAYISDTDEHIIQHNVTCVNLAQLEGKNATNVTVNLGLSLDIEVLEPGEITNKSSFALIVQPTTPVTTCTVNGATMRQDGLTFVANFTGQAQGTKSFNITCSGVKTASRQYNVTIDLTAPSMQSLSVLEAVCTGSGAHTKAAFSATDATGILQYVYSVNTSTGVAASSNTIQTTAVVPLSATNGSVRWEVSAVDLAGNRGGPKVVDAVCGSVSTGGYCGDGDLNAPGETCDGTDFNGLKCQDFGFTGGSLSCNSCRVITASCTGGGPQPATCGDNAVSSPETCDGSNLTGLKCQDFGFNGGTLTCSSCILNSSACTRPQVNDSCVTDSECDDNQMCVARKCTPVPNHCLNHQKDSDETHEDCGGSCPACSACNRDADCRNGRFCQNSTCVRPPVESCTVASDCGLNLICTLGRCVTAPPSGNTTPPGSRPCSTVLDCRNNEQCVSGFCSTVVGDVCSNGIKDAGEEDVDCGGDCAPCNICFSDSECPSGQVCSPQSRCVPDEGNDGACTSSVECPNPGDECVGGYCQAGRDDDNNFPPPPPPGPVEEEKSLWLPLTLLILGLLIMGGSGYFLYMQNEDKKAAAARRRVMESDLPTSRPSRFEPSPEQPGEDPRIAQERAREEQLAQAEAQKAQQRQAAFAAFDDGKRKKAKPKSAPAKAPAKKKPKDDGDEEAFDELDKLGK